MPLPAQLEIIEATYDVLEDRYVSPQELTQYMGIVMMAAIMMVLGSIFWEELTETYEESMEELR